MAGEEETETFAFQAEINQLLSLIINVSVYFMWYVPFLLRVKRVVFFSRWANLLIVSRAFFLISFSSLCAQWETDPFLSLFNSPTIHRRSTRTKRSFCENWSGTFTCILLSKTSGERKREEQSFVDATVRHSFPDRRRIGLSLLTMRENY